MQLVDNNGIFIDYSGKPDNLYVKPENFLNKKITDVLPPDVGNKSSTAINKALKTGEFQKIEYSLKLNNLQAIISDDENEISFLFMKQ